ncbi:hypothetical protein PIB30_031438 [Stylosanthes scabra]|uniref:Uncharacterized protein n=1 Tax=Stylosanthes scabra TaxID=79078 RepID=A0ABU6RCM2_9FABA|nr:hypothetical protein [Stylosanthes scabra]
MGACVSAPQRCVGGRLSSSSKRNKQQRKRSRRSGGGGGIRRRVSSKLYKGSSSLNNNPLDLPPPPTSSFANPTFQAGGSIEEAWFDSNAVFDSDCDDDYQSVPDDVLSFNGIEGGNAAGFPPSRDANHRVSADQMPKPRDLSSAGYSEAARTSDVQHFSSVDSTDHQSKSDGNIADVNEPVFVDEISSVDASSNKGEGILDNCGIIPNNCLPCLASTVPSMEKRRSSSSSPPSTRKKAPMKLSFKWKEGHGNATLFLQANPNQLSAEQNCKVPSSNKDDVTRLLTPILITKTIRRKKFHQRQFDLLVRARLKTGEVTSLEDGLRWC